MQPRTLLVLGVAAAVLLGGGGAVVYMNARGIRNNNPLNLREAPGDKTRWVGERATDDDPVFEEFETPEAGIRAAAVTLRTYRKRYGLRTLSQIIARWAPPNENDTAAYIRAVSEWSGIGEHDEVRDPDDFPRLLAAMIRMENGLNPYQLATIESGVAQA